MATREKSAGRKAAAQDDPTPEPRSRRYSAPTKAELEELLHALKAVEEGDFRTRLTPNGHPLMNRIAEAFNGVAERNERLVNETLRVSRTVGREGQTHDRIAPAAETGGWARTAEAINALISDLVQPTTEVARVLTAVANGDLSQKMVLDIDGKTVQGEFLRIGTTVNTMVDQLSSFASEVTRVAREVGNEGKLGVQAEVPGVAGIWKDLTDNVNAMAGNLTVQLRDVSAVATAIANGDLTRKITVQVSGEILQIKETINTMVDQLGSFASEVTRVAKEVGTEGQLGGQARVEGVAGIWKDLTDNVNAMAGNLTVQLRDVSAVATAIANGDLTQKITVQVSGEILQIKDVINSMVDQLRIFADEVTRVAREVGTEGELGGQAEVPNVAGTWKNLTDNVNFMASNLTAQVRNIAQVTTAVANGDLSKKITVDVKGEVAELKTTINTMVDQLSSFANEVTRVAKEVGTQGKLGVQAEVPGVAGIWKDLTDNVNAMAGNLTIQLRDVSAVATAIANGDLTRKITVQVSGEILQIKDVINSMVDQLGLFADEVTRVAREVGTEGQLGGQARVPNVAGTWKDLTDNVNAMAGNLTVQLRDVSAVATAIAHGDLTQKITVEVSGEILQIKETINTMVGQLRVFADEVTRVAKEVGTEGKLGGQAEVPGAAGTWRALTDNVNAMANSLTAQVRAIADVATSVTKGDLTRSITVDAKGELDELKRNLNQMIGNLKETTDKNREQDWLKTNLAKFSQMMQGQKNLESVSRMIMSELTPLVGAQHGAFFIADNEDGEEGLKMVASYAYRTRKHVNNRFQPGEGLVGQAALEKTPILLTNVPADYIQINSGLGEAAPRNVVVLPVVFEGEVRAVIELASFNAFSQIHQLFLDQLSESVGVVLNMIVANMRTEELLGQSQQLTQELQSQSEELQKQQSELKRSNAELEDQARNLKASEELLKEQQEELQQVNEELEEKASLLAEQNRKVEQKNREVELARQELEDKASQLALSSKYKSEFLANMSHELRTPLNSLLILAKTLAENPDGNLTPKQVEFADTIRGAGTDLLNLINDVLDLSKVEAGKMEIQPDQVEFAEIEEYVRRSFQVVAEQKALEFSVETAPELPATMRTDGQRLQQVLKNLLSNAFKFTSAGSVRLTMRRADTGRRFAHPILDQADTVVAFAVTDTGVGIAGDKQRLIFEAFQQEDGTTSRKYGGTGLGLSISREIARLLGGAIRVESTQGAGSTFTLFLPLHYTPPATPPGGTPLDRVEGMPPAPRAAAPALPPAAHERVPDDRDQLDPSDRVVLIVENDASFARILLDAARDKGFRGVVALAGEHALELVRRYPPDAVMLDMDLPGIDGWAVLAQLKQDPTTRHIPVHIISGTDTRQRGLQQGAVAYLEKPVSRETLEGAFEQITDFLDQKVRKLLIVEDNEAQRKSIIELIGHDDVEIHAVDSAAAAVAALAEDRFDCMVLDLGLHDMSGFELLEQVKADASAQDLPIIIYTGKDLSPDEETQLRRYAETIIVKDVRSPERLLDETALFLHRVEARLPEQKRRILEQLHHTDSAFAGKRVMIVDDDVRNIFSLTSVLERHGMEIRFAENGRRAIESLQENPEVDLVLMDVMMPEMDGYEATRALRAMPEFKEVPIISLTAKAMKGDREKCIEAGASDYITKPVDLDQLLSLMRVWLYR